MNIEEGMYIRNEDGYILNLTKENIYGYKSLIGNSNIKIKSYNIIDLIEVGDYVNGYKVLEIIKGFKILVDKLELNTYDGNYYLKQITNNQIKSIVTKEQFDSMKYEVDSNE